MAKVQVPSFTLADLIVTTADELRKVRNKAPKDAVLEFKSCEMELAVTVGAEVGGGIKFWFADASAKAKGETVSKVKLSFGPLSDNGVVAAARSRAKRPLPKRGKN